MPLAKAAHCQCVSSDKPRCRRYKIQESGDAKNEYENDILNIAAVAPFCPNVFSPIMFYLPLSTSEIPKFDLGPSLAGTNKDANQIIDFLLF